jgi:hypothetical protein
VVDKFDQPAGSLLPNPSNLLPAACIPVLQCMPARAASCVSAAPYAVRTSCFRQTINKALLYRKQVFLSLKVKAFADEMMKEYTNEGRRECNRENY